VRAETRCHADATPQCTSLLPARGDGWRLGRYGAALLLRAVVGIHAGNGAETEAAVFRGIRRRAHRTPGCAALVSGTMARLQASRRRVSASVRQ
jgi:hypothetical protein